MALKENAEMFVRADKKQIYTVINIGLIVLCIIVMIFMYIYLRYAAIFFGIPVIALFAFLSWFVQTRARVEYEYSIVAGVLTVSQITNQTKRRIIASTDAKDILEFGETTRDKMIQERSNQSAAECRFVDCSSADDDKMYFFKYRDVKYGMQKIYFSPDDKMLDALRIKSGEVMRAVRRV